MSDENKKHHFIHHRRSASNPPGNDRYLGGETFNQFIQVAQAMRVAGLTPPCITELLIPRSEGTNP